MPGFSRFARFGAIALSLLLLTVPARADESPPLFKDFPAGKIHKGRNAPPAIIDAATRSFRTALRKAAAGKVNFAGRYIVAEWGCGTSCVSGAVINAVSGQVTMFPFTISGWREVYDGFEPITYRLDSRLIVFSGQRNEEGQMGQHYYVLERGKLKFLRTVETSGDFLTPPQ